MAHQPEFQIRAGNPSPAEAEAARAAGMSPWVAIGRADATRRSGGDLRGRTARAWRWAGRLGQTISNIQIGRGDAR